MFIEEFKNEPLPLSSIQFAAGIALDSFNEQKYAKAVIDMYNPKKNDYDNAEYRSREDLENYLLSETSGLVESYIHFLYTNDCIYQSSANGKMYRNERYVSLNKIAHRVNETQLLHEVMNIILNYRSKYFIYLYLK